VFHLLQAILGLRADAPAGRLYVDPTLPHWLPDVTLRGVEVAGERLTLRFWREGDASRWAVLAQTPTEGPAIEVCQAPWQPWALPAASQPTRVPSSS
jgi:hypothetical protein